MPLSPTETRALLNRLGHEPNKKLGQNFLIDPNIVRKSLQLAEVTKGDHIIEIGPGLGTLTQSMLEEGAQVWAVEYDRRLASFLKETVLPKYGEDRFHLIQGDAVDYLLAGFNRQEGIPFKIVANLPYAISTPWLDGILAGDLPQLMVLMLQKEAADRYVGQPGTKNFGAISIFLQSAYNQLKGHSVAAQCFYPVPGVDSYLLHLRKKDTPLKFSLENRERIRRIFTQRRKQIGSLCKGDEHLQKWLVLLSEVGIEPNRRPETIPLEAWQLIEKVG